MDVFNNISSFVVVYGLMSLFSWSLYTVTVSQTPNIERAFGLSSAESGWLLTIWEIGYVLCSLVASYFGPRAHAPRVMALATILTGISGFVFALPHFVAYKDSNTESGKGNGSLDDMARIDFCVNQVSVDNDSELATLSEDTGETMQFSRKTLAYVLFNIGMILQGVSKAPCYPYSSQYVDDNGDKKKTGFYVGAISSIAIFGLALGYGVGSGVGNIYVTLQDTDLEPTDTRYIGAWWLAFIGVGAFSVLMSVPLFKFPRRMKSFQDTEQKKEQRKIPTNLKTEMRQVVKTLLSVAQSPVYTITLIAACVQIVSLSCFHGFVPKYMTTQFSVTPWKVNIILGVSSILAFSIGCLVGGVLTTRWKMSPFRNVLMIIVMSIIVLLFLIINTFMGCSQQDIFNVPGNDMAATNCDCSTTEFLPICGEDDRNYFSPCHAGCINGTSKIFSNCSAIPGGDAKIGLCSTDCKTMLPYCIVTFLMNMIDAVGSIPTFLVFLRAAGEKNKSLALGLSAAATALLGWLPGPVLGGKIVDSTCMFWNTASTAAKYCSFYNIESLRFKIHLLMIGLRSLSILILCLALFKARKLKRWSYEDQMKGTEEIQGQPMVSPGEKEKNHDY
ncbi:Solute carrier organic anion transporter member 5A1 [Mactra antiquata]